MLWWNSRIAHFRCWKVRTLWFVLTVQWHFYAQIDAEIAFSGGLTTHKMCRKQALPHGWLFKIMCKAIRSSTTSLYDWHWNSHQSVHSILLPVIVFNFHEHWHKLTSFVIPLLRDLLILIKVAHSWTLINEGKLQKNQNLVIGKKNANSFNFHDHWHTSYMKPQMVAVGCPFNKSGT